ncbi:type II toxin-antitoxin system RelE/ParE family toxin [Bradyrhizobium sp. HKCCYLR20261]|uniref:type II toxin-antitoxin system RelE/ParE family toxin n=1 Tax=Bradyrhizobium sp. HKCCYLR20261 TaxID=3420760 RepID=UPI003EB89AB3
MTKVVWTPAALRDVRRLHAFLVSKSPAAAQRAARAIRAGTAALRDHPQLGRQVKEMPPEFRERHVPFGNSGYVILYRYDGQQATILAVRHSREAGY